MTLREAKKRQKIRKKKTVKYTLTISVLISVHVERVRPFLVTSTSSAFFLSLSLSPLSRVDGSQRWRWGWVTRGRRRNGEIGGSDDGKGGGGRGEGGGWRERKRRAHEGYKYIIISYTARIFVKYAKHYFFLVNLSRVRTHSLFLSTSYLLHAASVLSICIFFPFLRFVIVLFNKC